MRSFLIHFMIFLTFLLVALEITFRTVLPASSHPRNVQDQNFQIIKFDRTWMASGTKTIGNLCRKQGKWTINGAGWNSQFEYKEKKTAGRLRIAIIGDSNIAGFPVDVDKRVDAQLFELLGQDADVYSFGLPGAPLSQFIGAAQYIEATFNPDIFLVYVGNKAVQNSFGRSSPYRFCVMDGADGLKLAPPSKDYHANLSGRFIYRSAIVRYLIVNRQVNADESAGGVLRLDENIKIAEQDLAPRDIQLAAFLMDKMGKTLPDDRVIFFTDALRGLLYRQETKPGPTIDFRLLKAASFPESKIDLLDLTQAMWTDYIENGEYFESPLDPHWNERGHQVAAQALFNELNILKAKASLMTIER